MEVLSLCFRANEICTVRYRQFKRRLLQVGISASDPMCEFKLTQAGSSLALDHLQGFKSRDPLPGLQVHLSEKLVQHLVCGNLISVEETLTSLPPGLLVVLLLYYCQKQLIFTKKIIFILFFHGLMRIGPDGIYILALQYLE